MLKFRNIMIRGLGYLGTQNHVGVTRSMSFYSIGFSKKCFSLDSNNKYPEHVAIIMDGNRRYAKRKSLLPWDGHKFGASTLEDLLRGIIEERTYIKEFSLFCFSTENFFREENEVKFLLTLLDQKLDEIRESKEIYEVSQIRFIGDLAKFEEVENDLNLNFGLCDKMGRIEDDTKENEGLKLNLCCGYGSRNEIVEGAKIFASEILEVFRENDGSVVFEEVEERILQLGENDFCEYLKLSNEPDLVIRTGDRQRTSNFLAYQTIYSEWFFLDVLWPEFTLDILDDVIDEFVHERVITNGI